MKVNDNFVVVQHADGSLGLIERVKAERQVRAGSMLKARLPEAVRRAGSSPARTSPPPVAAPVQPATVQVSAEDYRQLRVSAGIAEPEEYAPGEAYPAGWLPDVSRRSGVRF